LTGKETSGSHAPGREGENAGEEREGRFHAEKELFATVVPEEKKKKAALLKRKRGRVAEKKVGGRCRYSVLR